MPILSYDLGHIGYLLWTHTCMIRTYAHTHMQVPIAEHTESPASGKVTLNLEGLPGGGDPQVQSLGTSEKGEAEKG